MDGARPSSGAAATSRGPDGNRHPDGSAESRAHDARTLSTMDGTLRDSCERIRDRVAELAGDARPRVVSEMEAALSQVEYDLNGAEFLLAQLREALAVSAPPRDAPPVAAYRASLRGSRSALDAVREAARLARPRAAGDARRDAVEETGAVEDTPRRGVGAAAAHHFEEEVLHRTQLRAGVVGVVEGGPLVREEEDVLHRGVPARELPLLAERLVRLERGEPDELVQRQQPHLVLLPHRRRTFACRVVRLGVARLLG